MSSPKLWLEVFLWERVPPVGWTLLCNKRNGIKTWSYFMPRKKTKTLIKRGRGTQKTSCREESLKSCFDLAEDLCITLFLLWEQVYSLLIVLLKVTQVSFCILNMSKENCKSCSMKLEADLLKLKASACENLSIIDPSSSLKTQIM